MTETPPPVDYVAQAQLVHDNGPYKTPPSTLYFHFLKPAWGDQTRRKRSSRTRPMPRCI